jgi:hypothetical protein
LQDRGSKFQAVAEKARMGTAFLSNRGRVLLLVGDDSSFFEVSVFFLTDELKILTLHEEMQFHLTDELSESIFQQTGYL